jgi:hypothetical protein
VEEPQEFRLHSRPEFPGLRTREQEKDGYSGLMEVVKAIRTPALEVLIDLVSLLRLQQAKQEQLINVV